MQQQFIGRVRFSNNKSQLNGYLSWPETARIGESLERQNNVWLLTWKKNGCWFTLYNAKPESLVESQAFRFQLLNRRNDAMDDFTTNGLYQTLKNDG